MSDPYEVVARDGEFRSSKNGSNRFPDFVTKKNTCFLSDEVRW